MLNFNPGALAPAAEITAQDMADVVLAHQQNPSSNAPDPVYSISNGVASGQEGAVRNFVV